jgi:hypothetical protein
MIKYCDEVRDVNYYLKMNFANLKSKIKAINIQDFKLKKDGDGQ